MSEFREILDACFTAPVLPTTVLLILVTAYWVLAILGGLGLDFLDFDLDAETDVSLDVDADAGSFLGFGLLGLRFFNLGDVPLMLWMSIFAFSLWGLTLYFDHDLAGGSRWAMTLALARNAGVSLFVTKIATMPLRGRFKHIEPNRVQDMIGRTCTITTGEATESFGRARCHVADGVLDLHVRTLGGTLSKGTAVVIVDYDADKNTYLIQSTDQED